MSFGELGLELLLGMGLALFGANLWVLVQERRRRRADRRRRSQRPAVPSLPRVWMNLWIGVALAVGAALALIARG